MICGVARCPTWVDTYDLPGYHREPQSARDKHPSLATYWFTMSRYAGLLTHLRHALVRPRGTPPSERERIAMTRDELLQLIAAVPAGTDIGIQLGNEHLDIVDLVPWGDGQFIALKCHPTDLRDLLLAWELPREQRKQIRRGCGVENVSVVDKGGTE